MAGHPIRIGACRTVRLPFVPGGDSRPARPCGARSPGTTAAALSTDTASALTKLNIGAAGVAGTAFITIGIPVCSAGSATCARAGLPGPIGVAAGSRAGRIICASPAGRVARATATPIVVRRSPCPPRIAGSRRPIPVAGYAIPVLHVLPGSSG